MLWYSKQGFDDSDNDDAGHHPWLVSDPQHSHHSAGGGGDSVPSQEEGPSQRWDITYVSLERFDVYFKTICRNQGEEWVIRHESFAGEYWAKLSKHSQGDF